MLRKKQRAANQSSKESAKVHSSHPGGLQSKGRHSILRVAALLILLAGAWLVSVNLYHLIRSSLAERFYRPGSNPGAVVTDSPAPDTGTDLPYETGTDIASGDPQEETGGLFQGDTATAELYPELPEEGDKLGELSIPKIDAVYPVYEGTDENELDQGVGHYINSVLPGEKDNCVLSGHRNTVFDQLGELEKGDSLIVTTSAGTFEYTIQKIRIVDADDRTVIVPKPKATLTVTTCYPFVYIGPAPQRYILVAGLTKSELN